jgi:hypothetical protein
MLRTVYDDGTSGGAAGFCLAHDQPFSIRSLLLLIETADKHLHLELALRITRRIRQWKSGL